MGCTSSQNENQSEKIILLKNIKEKINQLIKINPFYNISIKEFNKFMKENSKNNSIENIIKMIINTFSKEEYTIINSIIKNVIMFSHSKFKCIFRTDNIDEYIKKLIFYLLYFFLTENQRGRYNFLYIKLNKLFEKIKLKEEGNNFIFKTGKFSFVLLNLIQFHTFCFIYFFCGQGVMEIAANFKKYELKSVFVNEIKSEKYYPDKINKIINDYLFFLNHNIQPNKVNYIILTDVLQPLSEYINENKNEEIFSINREKLKKILDILIEKINHNSYVELFFNIENSLE